MLVVNQENYFSLEVENEYMGRSQYLGFLECEEAQVARLAGTWQDEKPTAFLVGSYTHAWSQGILDQFKREHPEILTQKKELRSEFKHAEIMIDCLKNDPLCMYMLEGEKEVVYTAEFAGAAWKVMIDVKHEKRKRMVDLKTTKSITDYLWNEELRAKVNFVEQYNYPLQAALYSEIERRACGREEGDWLENYLVAVSKEPFPDKAVIHMNDPERYQLELERIELNMPRVLAVKSGAEKPVRCERCSYCRSTKKLTKAIHYSEL